MNSSRKMLGLSMIATAIASFGNESEVDMRYVESDNERQKRMMLAEQRQNLAKGLRQFHYRSGEIPFSVWAVNQKNADKKYKKFLNSKK